MTNTCCAVAECVRVCVFVAYWYHRPRGKKDPKRYNALATLNAPACFFTLAKSQRLGGGTFCSIITVLRSRLLRLIACSILLDTLCGWEKRQEDWEDNLSTVRALPEGSSYGC